MSEHKTEVIVNARAKGFQQVQQQATKLVDSATKAATNQTKGYSTMEKSTRSYRKEIKALEGQLRDLGKEQLRTLKAMEGVSRVTPLYKQLHETFKNLNADSQRLNQRLALTKNLFGPKGAGGRPLTDADMARGGFTQGFAQSLGLNLQRGPGMWRQAAGAATGTMLKGFAGSPFGGVSGVTQGLAGIPVVGGFAAGQFQNAMQFGEGALGVQRSRLGMAAYLGAGETGSGIREARARGRSGVKATDFDARGRFATSEEIAARGEYAMMDAAKEQTDPLKKLERAALTTGKIMLAGAKAVGKGMLRSLTGGALGQGDLAAGVMSEFEAGRTAEAGGSRIEAAGIAAMNEAGAPEVAYHKARQAAGETAARQARAEPFQEIRTAGLKYGGMSEADALQAAQGVLQVAGGGMGDLRESGMLNTSFAAQTRYGLGADVTGAFAGAGRTGRGGLVGMGGAGVAASEKMTIAIQDGLSLGLEGSELQEYMGQMAQGIQAWKATGIPINPSSIARMGQAITQSTTLGGLRGGAIGRGLASAAQNVSATGVQDAIDLQMLQTMGGFKGGSLEDYEAAQVKMEEMGGAEGWGPEQLQEIVQKLTAAGGGGASGRQVLRKAFARKGIQMSQAETIALEKGATGASLSAEEEGLRGAVMGKIDTARENMPMDATDLQEQAAEIMKGYGSAVQRASAIQNLQNTTGEKLMTTLQNLQESQALVTKSFTNLATGGLDKVSGLISDFAKSLETATSSFDKAAMTMDLIGNLAKQF